MIYTSIMLLDKYSKYANPFNKIRDEVKSGRLIKVCRGLYEDDKLVSPMFLSSYIYSPSYISFEYALSYHGLIPEHAVNVTSASFNKNKSKIYRTPYGTYIYRDIPKDVFGLYTELKEEKGYSYIIASKEKALCDLLYIKKPIRTIKELKELLFDDLRIDKRMFNNLNKDILLDLSSKYKKRNLKLLNEYIKGGISE